MRNLTQKEILRIQAEEEEEERGVRQINELLRGFGQKCLERQNAVANERMAALREEIRKEMRAHLGGKDTSVTKEA